MAPHLLHSWLLAPVYLAGVLAMLGAAFLMGGIWSRFVSVNAAAAEPLWAQGAGLYSICRRTALGLATATFAVSLIGVAGHFRSLPVFAVLALLSAAGALRKEWHVELRAARTDLLDLHKTFSRLSRFQRFLVAIPVAVAAAITVNALIGGLNPPMWHDAMWYHLSVPRQWVFSQYFAAYPDVMPSNYPMAGNALYAIILLAGGNAALCNAFYAACGVLLLASMAAATAALTVSVPGRGSMAPAAAWLCVGVWLPVVAREALFAPTLAQNDIFALLWVFVGMVELWHSWLRSGTLTSSHAAIAGGFLLGTGAAAKLVTLLAVVSAPAVALLGLFVGIQKNGAAGPRPLRMLAIAALISAAIIIGYLPWAIRGLHSSGLPFFPLGSSVFNVTPEFRAALATSQEWNGTLASGRGGVSELMAGMVRKLDIAAQTGTSGVFLFGVIALLSIVLLRGYRRLYGVFLTLYTSALFLIPGGLEVLRYFSMYFPLAAPAVAWVLLELGSRNRLLLVGTVLSILSAGGYATRQVALASATVYDYNYRPVLAKSDMARRAAQSAMASHYLGFEAWRPLIAPDARVFLPDSGFPFYLNRDTLWNDPAVRDGISSRWSSMSPAEAAAFLLDKKIDTILYTKLPDDQVPGQIAELLRQGIIRELPRPSSSPPGWRVFAVNDGRAV